MAPCGFSGFRIERAHATRLACEVNCWPRHAQGLVAEKKVFEVHIEQGHKHNAKVVLRGAEAPRYI